MSKGSKKIVLLIGVLVLLAFVITACGQQAAPPQTPAAQETPKEEGKPEGEATYIGTATCVKCHQDKGDFTKSKHYAEAFKPLSAYELEEPLGEVTIFDTATTDQVVSTTFDFTKDKVFGVMMDHYIVAEVPAEAGFKGTADGKMWYRVGALHQEGDKWAFEPASKGDYDKDGKEDLGASAYTCFSCHSPGIAAAEPKEYGISCETCHGPGSVHLTAENKKDTMTVSQDACLSCHQDGKPVKDANGKYTTQNHYGTRGYFLSTHAQSTKLNNCLACHTSHNPNGEGKLIAAENGKALCMICHSDKQYDPAVFMWINETDQRGHFVKDHSFGKMMYGSLGDDPATPVIEITNPALVEQLDKIIK